MDDLISRQAAVDAILAVTGNSSVRELYEHVQEHGLSDMWSGGVNAAIDIIIAVPSVQPKRTEERTGTHACDLIDRQAAIDAVLRAEALVRAYGYRYAADAVRELPSAQPEISCSEIPNSSDLISRQAVIDALDMIGSVDTDADREYAMEVFMSLPSVQPLVLTCDGCRHVGTYDTDFPCSGCIRREKDYYEQER